VRSDFFDPRWSFLSFRHNTQTFFFDLMVNFFIRRLACHLCFVGTTLDVGTFFTYFHAHGLGLALRTGGTDLAHRFTFQGDSLRASGSRHLAVTTAQITEELYFLLLGDGLIRRLFGKTCFPELYQQAFRRDTNYFSKLFYGYFCHLSLPASGLVLLGKPGSACRHDETRRTFLIYPIDVR
jgi:hypothetical protein